MKQHGVHQAEDGGISGDAEGHGENRDGSKARGLGQQAKCEAQILKKASHQNLLLVAQSHQRIDARCPVRGDEASQQGHAQE